MLFLSQKPRRKQKKRAANDVKVLGVVLQVEHLLVNLRQVAATIIPHFGLIHGISVLMHDINFSRQLIYGN